MCSVFGLQMENYQGDLNDIVRASGGCSMGCAVGGSAQQPVSDVPSASTWQQQQQQQQFPSDVDSDPLNFPSSAMEDDRVINGYFGDPFSTMRDPLLHELNVAAATAASTYFGSPNSAVDDTSTFSSHKNNKIFEDDMRSGTGPCNIFSRIQISPSSSKLALSPCDSPPVMAAAAGIGVGVGVGGVNVGAGGVGVSPRGIKEPAGLSSDMINANSSKGCLIDNTGQASLQISSPRNLGIKRRKSQAKKVVCIPAPAAASSRSTGEVVPSDLWAWRKYGQKPIKGSPYPRGYYRCSSSKGCSARKQVERSRTDPNMLVITYTSEHNHPWPTQRNALAGSTRSQPSKNSASSASKTSPGSQPQNSVVNPKEELKESSSNDALSPTVGASSSTASAPVKEEIEDTDDQKQLDMDDHAEQFGEAAAAGNIPQTYRPALPDCSSEDFFADLDEIEADLLFTQGFSADQDDEQKENKSMDPFSLFDWPTGDNNNNSNPSF